MRVGPALLILWGAPALFPILVQWVGGVWIRPDPVMVATLFLAFQPPRRFAWPVILGMGVLVDLASAAPVRGIFLAYLAAYALARFLSRRIGSDHALGLFALSAACFLTLEAADLVLSGLGGHAGASGSSFFRFMVRLLLSSAACAGVLLLLQKTRADARLARWMGFEERRALA